jgi:D-apionate oxidoisomerase
MRRKVALIGAGGKMGMRAAHNLRDGAAWELGCCEISDVGRSRLAQLGLTARDANELVPAADFIVFAVPDAAVRIVSRDIVPLARPGATFMLLDPAAAMAGEVALRPDASFLVTHPCHPPLFNQETTPEARADLFGGIAARQDVVMALMQGPESAWQDAELLARDVFAPVVEVHRITVEQMAILEPAMAEVCAASAAMVIKEAMDEAVRRGVPEAAARSFMLGHAQVPLAILFGIINADFSDAAKIAIAYGRRHIVQEDWRKVFEPEHVLACIGEMLHPHGRP